MITPALLTSDNYGELRAVLQLAIPLASAQVAQFAAGFVDTIMMGHLGQCVTRIAVELMLSLIL